MKVKEMQSIIINGSDKDFLEFIRNNFEKKSKENIVEYRNNLDTLKLIDDDTLATGIARILKFENHFAAIKALSFIFAILGYLITYYSNTLIAIYESEILPNVMALCMTIFLFIFVCKFYYMERNEANSCVYFKALLEYVKETKNKSRKNN